MTDILQKARETGLTDGRHDGTNGKSMDPRPDIIIALADIDALTAYQTGYRTGYDIGLDTRNALLNSRELIHDLNRAIHKER